MEDGSARHRLGGVRPITWFIVTVNVIFPFWVLHGLQAGATLNCAKIFYDKCVPGPEPAGSPLLPMLLMWVFVDIALAIAWVITRPRPQLQGPSPYS